MDFKKHLEQSIGIEIDKIDFDKPFVVITKFKQSGKYYTTEARNLIDKEIKIINNNRGFFLLDVYKNSEFIVQLEGYNLEGFFHHLII